jgi:hypothetical protein
MNLKVAKLLLVRFTDKRNLKSQKTIIKYLPILRFKDEPF